jgi:hypothetical protein
MRPGLCRELTELEQDARAVGRADLVHHVQGCRQILEVIILAIDMEARRASPTDRDGQHEDYGRRPQT